MKPTRTKPKGLNTHRMSRPLSPQQAKFVELYCGGKNAREAATLAGYSPKTAYNAGHKLATYDGPVKDAIAAYKAKTAKVMEEVAGFTAKTAMEELDRGLEFAIATKNATAFARFTELKMKMSGLLDKAVDANQAQFSINIVGLTPPEAAKVVTIEPQQTLSIQDLLS